VPCDNFLYGFKGARSAPGPGWPPILASAATDALTGDAAQLPPVAGRASGGTLRCKSGPSSRRSSVKLGKITRKSASRHT
jgi:hypothetical protein